jgi:hypothetical protein
MFDVQPFAKDEHQTSNIEHPMLNARRKGDMRPDMRPRLFSPGDTVKNARGAAYHVARVSNP